MIRRRRFVLGFAWLPLLARASEGGSPLRGKLIAGDPAFLEVNGRRRRILATDDARLVLADTNLNGADFEVIGSPAGEDFQVNPMHTRPLFAYQNGKRLYVTYWCDVCYIRTYAPGKCWCCQKDTELDLREKLDE